MSTPASVTSSPQVPDAGQEALALSVARLVSLFRERISEHEVLRGVIDTLPDKIFVKDRQSRFILVNRAASARYGFTDPLEAVGRTDFDLFPRDVAQAFFDEEQALMRADSPLIGDDVEVIGQDGRSHWFQTTKYPLHGPDGAVIGLFGINRIVSAQKMAAIQQAEQTEVFKLIATNAPLSDIFRHIVALIEAQTEGVYASIMLREGTRLRAACAPGLPAAYVEAIDGVEIGPDVGSCGTACWRRAPVIVEDIETDPLWVSYVGLTQQFGLRSCWSTPIVDGDGVVLGTFALYSRAVRCPTECEIDLVELCAKLARIAIERHQAELRIHAMAERDPLTGLANRLRLDADLSRAIETAGRNGERLCVAFIDLDNFKLINDSLGHRTGDHLLRILAARMTACTGPDAVIARLGGDEFVVVLAGLPGLTDGVPAAIRAIVETIREPVALDERTLSVSTSVGVAFYPEHGDDADTLLANADAAMYEAKRCGRNTVHIFTECLHRQMREQLAWSQDLARAIAVGEILLHYQPQIDLRSGRIVGVEALVRWQHPVHGLIGPDRFIPVAEASGLIVSLGDVVLRAACRQMKAWREAGALALTVCVNVSAHQFRGRILGDQVLQALAETGLEPGCLELELTESMLMGDEAEAVATMLALRAQGVHFAIDDFGTGFSNLSAIRKYPVERLKIDQSFIRDIETDENDRAIASAIIVMAQKLNMRVLAEGVETEAQRAFLVQNNCDEIQGFL